MIAGVDIPSPTRLSRAMAVVLAIGLSDNANAVPVSDEPNPNGGLTAADRLPLHVDGNQ